MSESDFKLFDIMRDRTPENFVEVCEHKCVFDGVCGECFEILFYENKFDFDYYTRASPSSVSRYNRVNHFIKFLDKREGLTGGEFCKILKDFEDFIWAFDRIDKGKRKNFLLNGWVLWKISERRGIDCKQYKIKNAKSGEEHERLCGLVFDKLKWV